MLVWSGTELATIHPDMLDALRRTGLALAAGGTVTGDLDGRVPTPRLTDTHATVMAYEAARSLSAEAEHPDQLSAHLRELLDRGPATPEPVHRAAQDFAHEARARILQLLADTDAILGPAAPGPAPYDLEGTGTPILSRPWQLLGLPVVAVPGHRDPHGMPLGLQLIGHPDRVSRLLGMARHTEELIRRTAGSPR
ncbi:hypothetical protein [Streptomyces sp. NPDC097610]|uniref:hypothetical protein n=1 Tax=Streptomyces sp. NPDC097610 TaxID=3157227 RepID=UPI003326015B